MLKDSAHCQGSSVSCTPLQNSVSTEVTSLWDIKATTYNCDPTQGGIWSFLQFGLENDGTILDRFKS